MTVIALHRIYNVLFLCTGNSARSIIGESILNHDGEGRFRAYSAGSHPKGTVHPMALTVLDSAGFPFENARSKGWEEFASPDAPQIDFIFTVCDDAAGEICPIWPGHPMTAHWGIEDPAAVEGEGQQRAFEMALRYLKTRISLFLSLPITSIDRMTLSSKLRQIGQSEGATTRNETVGA
ncbi:arsenate reductase ArsC [soil metagenome]